MAKKKAEERLKEAEEAVSVPEGWGKKLELDGDVVKVTAVPPAPGSVRITVGAPAPCPVCGNTLQDGEVCKVDGYRSEA